MCSVLCSFLYLGKSSYLHLTRLGVFVGISYPKAVDVKANPSGKGVVIVTMDNETCTPKDTFAEETVTAESMKEYHAAVEAACKKAGREDLVRVVFSKVAKLVECDADEE